MRHHHQCGGNYTKLVPEKVWAHFKDCYYKLLRISAHEYPRLRNSTEIVDGLVELVVLCDAAQGMVITAYTPNDHFQNCFNDSEQGLSLLRINDFTQT